MKKAVYFILLLLIILIFAYTIQPGIRYPAGIDTLESFGDGTYQLLSGETECLYNCKYGSTIIPQVEHFQITNGKLYVSGNSTQRYTYDGIDKECTYDLYAVIEIENNSLTLCVISNGSDDPGIYIYRLDEMTKNCDIRLLSQMTDFSNADQSVFEEFGHLQNNE